MTRIDIGNGDRAFVFQKLGQGARLAKIRAVKGQIFDNQTSRVDTGRFKVLFVHAAVAHVRISQRHQLAAIARVGQDFLISRERCVEDHFTHRVARGADGRA